MRDILNKLDNINEATGEDVLGFIDEYADGDVWLIKAPANLAPTFLRLANSIESEAPKNTMYDPETGHMAKMHQQLGVDTDAPQWAAVSGPIPAEVQQELASIKPITTNVVNKLKSVQGDMQEFMAEYCWALEEAGLAVVSSAEAEYAGNTIRFSAPVPSNYNE